LRIPLWVTRLLFVDTRTPANNWVSRFAALQLQKLTAIRRCRRRRTQRAAGAPPQV
jgi:hypothetical protein